LEERYYQEKKKVKDILKDLGIILTPTSVADDVYSQVEASPKFEFVDQKTARQIISNVCTFFDQLMWFLSG
jgi:hypothetical protein